MPPTVGHGITASATEAVAVNAALLTLFAVQHSVMARPWFKPHWTRWVPAEIERSTDVVAASAALGVLYWQWRTLPARM